MQSGFEAVPVVVVEGVAVALVIGFVSVIGIEDGVSEAAGVTHDRDGAVFQADELGQTTGFIFAGNEDDVGAGVDKVGEFFVVADFEVAIGMIVVTALEVPKCGIDLTVRTRAEENKLAATVKAIWDGVKNQVNALLMIETAHERNNRTELFSQPEAISKGVLVGVFVVDGLG